MHVHIIRVAYTCDICVAICNQQASRTALCLRAACYEPFCTSLQEEFWLHCGLWHCSWLRANPEGNLVWSDTNDANGFVRLQNSSETHVTDPPRGVYLHCKADRPHRSSTRHRRLTASRVSGISNAPDTMDATSDTRHRVSDISEINGVRIAHRALPRRITAKAPGSSDKIDCIIVSELKQRRQPHRCSKSTRHRICNAPHLVL